MRGYVNRTRSFIVSCWRKIPTEAAKDTERLLEEESEYIKYLDKTVIGVYKWRLKIADGGY
jgi:hypothetical protein